MPRFSTLRSGRANLTKTTRDEAERRAALVLAAAAAFRPSLIKILNQAWQGVRDSADTTFASRVSAGQAAAAIDRITLADTQQTLGDELSEQLELAYQSAGTRAAAVWTEYDLDFDGQTENVLRQARQRSSTLVREITTSTRNGIRLSIQEAIERGDNVTEASRSIRPLIGNLERHVKAVEAYRARLLNAGGLTRAKIDNLAGRYAQQLLNKRALSIARTEMLWSANAAQHEYWVQLRSAGLIPVTSTRVWVVADDDRLCEQCAPMDGEVVAFDEQFISLELGRPGEPLRQRNTVVLAEFPPLHPMCRCTISLQTL